MSPCVLFLGHRGGLDHEVDGVHVLAKVSIGTVHRDLGCFPGRNIGTEDTHLDGMTTLGHRSGHVTVRIHLGFTGGTDVQGISGAVPGRDRVHRARLDILRQDQGKGAVGQCQAVVFGELTAVVAGGGVSVSTLQVPLLDRAVVETQHPVGVLQVVPLHTVFIGGGGLHRAEGA